MPTARGHRAPIHRWLAGVAAVAVVSGCGATDPSLTPQAEVPGGAIGPDVAVTEDVKLLQVQIEYPTDGVYEPGEDARLFLGISNSGPEPLVLTDVTGPDFTDAVTTGAGDGENLAITVPANDNVYVGAENEPAIILTDLDQQLRSSQSIPVTFTFSGTGSVTVEAMVAAEGQTPSPTYDFPDPDEDPTTEG